LPDTLKFFGGFPYLVAVVLFAFYAVLSSVQFLLVGWLTLKLRTRFPIYLGLSFPLAWFTLEFLFPRLFPWGFAHPLIELTRFSLLASYFGVTPLSFIVLWCAELCFQLSRANRRERRILIGASSLLIAVLAGLSQLRMERLRAELSAAPSLQVALVQGNLAAKQKGDIRYLSANLERYRELSTDAIGKGAELLVWPESVMNVWTPETSENVSGTKYDPFPTSEVPLLYGGLSFRARPLDELRQLPRNLDPDEAEALRYLKFNTAFVRSHDGQILGLYHKRVLMPFGEYLPLAETFPIIRKISPQSGDFSSGDKTEPISVPFKIGAAANSPSSFKLGLLICYEDLLSELSREISSQGANLLINITNDAWYGETAAPYQHHLLASWRAIETGRYLLRSTNTGLTAIVDPWGRTRSELAIFTEGVLNEKIQLLSETTSYALRGDSLSYLLCLLVLLACLFKPQRRS